MKLWKNRGYRGTVAVGGLGFALLLIWLNVPFANSVRDNARQLSVAVPPTTSFVPDGTESASTIVASGKGTPTPGNSPEPPRFTKTEQAELARAENAVFQVVKNIERENASVAMERPLKDGWVLALAISPPSVEQIGEVAAAIGKQSSSFASRPALEAEARKRLERVYWGALMFRKDHRTVYFTTDSSEKVHIMEVNSDSDEPVPPREDGRFVFDYPTITVNYGSDDSEPNSEDTSWSDRYGHLVETNAHKLRRSLK